MNRNRDVCIVIATWVAALLLPVAAWACPTCKEALDEGAASGFYWSTLFLISTPFLVVGTAGGAIAFVYWRAARRQALAWSAAGAEKE